MCIVWLPEIWRVFPAALTAHVRWIWGVEGETGIDDVLFTTNGLSAVCFGE
jgi:hypothetical protein